MGVISFSLFLGLVGGIFTGGITSIVLFFMDQLTLAGIWVSVVNSFLVGLICGSVAGTLRSLNVPVMAVIESLTSNSELAVKLVAGALTVTVLVLFFLSTIWAPIITSQQSEDYIWNWPGVRTFEFRLFLKSPLDQIDLLNCNPKSNPTCEVLPSK